MLDIFSLDYTLSLLPAIEKIDPPFSLLQDMFFSNKNVITTDMVAVEYKRTANTLAPFLITNTKGIDISRDTSNVRYYAVPTVGGRRTIGLGDLKHRQFGEIPNLYNAPTPMERQARMQAQDLTDLMRLIANRKNQMAAEILLTGKLELKQYADDGRLTANDTIDFNYNPAVTPAITWDNANATIYSDLMSVSEEIQETAGTIPTVAICGANIESYLLKNKEIKDWLMIPNRQNLTMANFAPRYTSPNARFIGTVNSLNLDIYSYNGTYLDENGNKQKYIPDDTLIIGVQGFGQIVYAPVDIFQNGNWNRISADTVPFYTYNDDAQTTSLTVYSRFIQMPDVFGSWKVIKARG